jgi:hypothetical protein
MATVSLGRMRGAEGFARVVAVKRLHSQFATDPEFVTMLADEARVASRVRHPNVVPVLDVVKTDAGLFLVMEYVHGESLAAIRRKIGDQEKPAPMSVAAAIVSGVLQGLHAAHEAADETGRPLNIVHRDVSPQNILVGADGVARVVDFGIAKSVANAQSTGGGVVKGKVAYMAPEQLSGTVDRRCDVYAAAVVLWELLSGRRLYTGEHASVVAQVLAGRPPRLCDVAPHVPEELEDIVMCGLDPSPDNRFATAREMDQALQRATPPANASIVADWLQALMGDELQMRALLVADFELTSVGAHGAATAPRSEGTVTNVTAATSTGTRAPSYTPRSLFVIGLAALAVAGIAVAYDRTSRVALPDPAVAAVASPSGVEAPSHGATSHDMEQAIDPLPSASTAAVTVPSAAAPHARRKAKCDPPYHVDAMGKRHFLLECL